MEEERLQYIPEKYWAKHEFSFYLHDKIAHLLVEYASSGMQHVVTDAFMEAIQGHEDKFEGIDILDWLKEHGLIEPYKHHLISHIQLALTEDMLHFLFEALTAFEKRKFSVGFSLLRKPLKEHLIFLSWILADEDDFLSGFESDTYKALNRLRKPKQQQIISDAVSKLQLDEFFDPDLIWDIIFSKNEKGGFEPVWQRATHLVTSMGALLKTEDYSLNFIFEAPLDDEYYEFIYSKLPYVLLYILQVCLECFQKIDTVNKRTYSHLVLATKGAFEALFVDGRNQSVSGLVNKTFKGILVCTSCDSEIKIGKRNGAQVYLTETMLCNSCGLETQVPLYWLLSRAKLNFLKDEDK